MKRRRFVAGWRVSRIAAPFALDRRRGRCGDGAGAERSATKPVPWQPLACHHAPRARRDPDATAMLAAIGSEASMSYERKWPLADEGAAAGRWRVRTVLRGPNAGRRACLDMSERRSHPAGLFGEGRCGPRSPGVKRGSPHARRAGCTDGSRLNRSWRDNRRSPWRPPRSRERGRREPSSAPRFARRPGLCPVAAC